jgi:hypothetical protein
MGVEDYRIFRECILENLQWDLGEWNWEDQFISGESLLSFGILPNEGTRQTSLKKLYNEPCAWMRELLLGGFSEDHLEMYHQAHLA